MSKSPVVIGAIGIAGCLALSLTLREALDMQQHRRRDPLELALESRFGAVLASPARVRNRRDGDRITILVELQLRAGARSEGLVEAAAQLIWAGCQTAERAPEAVWIGLADAAGSGLQWHPVARPRAGR